MGDLPIDTTTLLVGALPLLGVALGNWFSERGEARRWRRDWLTTRIRDLREQFAEVAEAINWQVIICAQHVEGAAGQRIPITQDKIGAASDSWRRVYARSMIQVPHEVQHALHDFDQARDRVARAVSAGDAKAANAALADLDAARTAVLNAVNPILTEMNESLAPLLIRPRTRLWWRLRGKPLQKA